ncbi:putative low-affinity phosphate transporter [Clavispora lusitaniae]|uniref:Low-affinity phosphate transporter n=1 Tax=Clavispora lusitaniae TaxID=36911 RepID=A0ACD0WKG6_CLALS|nr:putative low-affinity phosphate transporter [Clavispora lusitaniae]QFZ33701.1 putative low-affinity phosphate transporter [Clavispora lusitaniae]QFZ39372.1 putative low-affinity phosphate transporter [Clavispora lusitaniae]QFZ45054.1 putative low-affinity phosphate transporter [Clavispora lusitaniae]QFZ50731.1 putative low-affinity phosphate transporter [Clavispora lusitaniae]
MKFSHSLQFNAVPEWSSKYISYTTLKKLIYSLQRESLRRQKDDLESSHLISNESSSSKDPSVVFVAALDAELKKIDEFYQSQEAFVFQDIDDLMRDIDVFENDVENVGNNEQRDLLGFDLRHYKSNSTAPRRKRASDASGELTTFVTDPETEYTQDDDYEEGDNVHNTESNSDALRKTKSSDYPLRSQKSQAWDQLESSVRLPPQLILLSETRVLLRKRIINMYTTISELKSYVELNQTGFKKALKKFDKSLDTNLKDEYLSQLPERTYVFKKSTMEKLDEKINSLIEIYAIICNHGNDLEAAKAELSIHLRDHVVWERNTVWRDMIGMERKSQAANSKASEGPSSNEKANSSISSFNISFQNPTIVKLCLIVGVTLLLLNFSPFDDIAQKNCFALLVCASLLWATETIPLFVTSLLIPMMIVMLGVLKNVDGTPMDSVESSKFILSTMWNSVILLLLGGFTLAASLTKYNIAKVISTWILAKAGTRPPVVLLTIMSIALFASMWVSNVAAPVLCFSLIQPLLRTLPKGSKFINALILGIALASNVGGMASPIASPQNMIAIGSMDPAPSWGQWFVIALPVCILSLLLIWVFLLITFDCNSKKTQLVPFRTGNDKFTKIQWFIVGVSMSTILLWCFASRLEGVFGEMGIIALIPLILFFGTGLLTTEDFNNYPWNIVVLAMGGTALGKAVASSGLLSTIAIQIQREVEDFSLFGVTLTFGLLILIMATFVSHTVAALIVVPLVAEIGNKMEDPHPRLLIMASALLCSAAMGLPTSGFPNVTAICMTDEFGKPYLTVGTFITRGVPSSVIAYCIIVTIGYATMKLINF